jgi:hypothetical protein
MSKQNFFTMEKIIKRQLWDVYFNAQIPELTEQKNERLYQQFTNVKLANPEKNRQVVQGLVISCQNAWEANDGTTKSNEISVDVSSLWKTCVQEKDIYKLANCLQYQIHMHIPAVYAKLDVQLDCIIVRLIDRTTMKPPFVEKWLHSKVQQKHSEFAFDKLESFYKTQPVWMQRKHNFITFVKNLFNAVKEVAKELLSFKIDKQSKKVVLQYA